MRTILLADGEFWDDEYQEDNDHIINSRRSYTVNGWTRIFGQEGELILSHKNQGTLTKYLLLFVCIQQRADSTLHPLS